MKVTKKYETLEKVCPDGHKSASGLSSTMEFMAVMAGKISGEKHAGTLKVYCGTCGKKLVETTEKHEYEQNICPACKMEIPETWKYCSFCGVKL